MKFFLFVAFLAVLVAAVAAWEKEDHEIFDLVSDVEASEGKGTTFYSWLGVPSTATTSEIAKAYRKMSMTLHPDKNPNLPNVASRFARLGVVSTILRNKESRDRYDFFYKNGVPKWRGTGYYYSRFRPGLGTVFVFLTIVTSSMQYFVQKYNYRRDLERVETLVKDARAQAWGPKMNPLEGKRKVKVAVGRNDESNGRMLDMVVDGQDVYFLDNNGDLILCDASAAIAPSITGTWFLSLVASLPSRVGLTKAKPTVSHEEEEEVKDTSDEDGYDFSDAPPSGGEKDTLKGGKALPASKAGGKRRKVTRR